jgi:uncharacterized protein (DUF433 family)
MTRARYTGTAQQAEQQMDRLIAQFVEPYPGRPDPAEARLKVAEGSVSIWALIGALTKDGENAEAVARDYRVRRAAVDAAWAYYQRHRAAIDAKLASALVP